MGRTYACVKWRAVGLLSAMSAFNEATRSTDSSQQSGSRALEMMRPTRGLEHHGPMYSFGWVATCVLAPLHLPNARNVVRVLVPALERARLPPLLEQA